MRKIVNTALWMKYDRVRVPVKAGNFQLNTAKGINMSRAWNQSAALTCDIMR